VSKQDVMRYSADFDAEQAVRYRRAALWHREQAKICVRRAQELEASALWHREQAKVCVERAQELEAPAARYHAAIEEEGVK
jgi:hypothetical protein